MPTRVVKKLLRPLRPQLELDIITVVLVLVVLETVSLLT